MPDAPDLDGLIVRTETNGDIAAIRQVITSAFDSKLEASLVDKLREDGDLVLSLVAELNGKIVGYAGFSRLEIESRDMSATALAPVTVARCHRSKGVATALVREGLRRLEAAGEDIVFVLGDPPYYERFGFSSRVASQYSAQWSGPAFMALELDRAERNDHRPRVQYPQAFEVFG